MEDWEECGLNMIFFEGDVVYNSFGGLCVFVRYSSQSEKKEFLKCGLQSTCTWPAPEAT